MLFVFHVDTGTMITFDINLALENVSKLKEEIEKTCQIQVDKQVLLVSGGECLESHIRVCSYSAGTDTNPIFLFSKATIEGSIPPSPSIDYGSDPDLKDDVDESLNLEPSINTVTVRCQLAQHMCELAKLQAKVCEKLVHDQHLQQQGWAAVIANLDDITSAFKTRSENFESSFKQHLKAREQYLSILESFRQDVNTLSKIPILPALLDKESSTSCEGEAMDQQSPSNLLHWISSKDSQSSIEQLAEQCRKGLDHFDDKTLHSLQNDVRSVLEGASSGELREIKGLEERLYGLEQLRCDTKKIVQEQTDLAQAFSQNQARASNLGDLSILPDLCMSHKRQLVVMLRNHQHLLDIRRRCVQAKKELSINLYQRLKWVMFIESKISEMDTKLVMHHENVKRLRQHLEIVSQIHVAPNVYLTAVAEVVRRRTFSQAFLVWANDLAYQLCAVHSEEVARRKNFQSQFEGHFLSSLFPGLEDSPPPFATQAPPLFDSDLPKLCLDDIEKLRNDLPELALSLSIPDLTSITQFFLSRSIANLKPEALQHCPAGSIEDRIVEAVSAAGLSSNLDPALLLQPVDNSQSNNTQPISSDRGFESETDTEEFEKVGQCPCDVNKVESDLRKKLKTRLDNINAAVNDAVGELRSDMGQLKKWVLCERSDLETLLHHLDNAWAEANKTFLREKFELETRLKAALENVETETARRQELESELEDERQASRVKLEDLMSQHKSEVNAVISRYRAVSRSTISHDKLETRELMERSVHESILNEERSKWEKQTEHELTQMKIKADADRQILFNETVRKAVADHQRQLGDLRLRESMLIESCNKRNFRERGDSSTASLMARIEDLEKENSRLNLELRVLKSGVSSPPRCSSPSSSVVILESDSSGGSREEATSPVSDFRVKASIHLMKEDAELIDKGVVNVKSCEKGTKVLVAWDDNLKAFRIVQSSRTDYILHSDCLSTLKLDQTTLTKTSCMAEVIKKEFCRIKKKNSSYGLPDGSKFYRVVVKPLFSNR